MSERDIPALQQRLRAFAAARGWERYHTPKNLVMALAGEAGELAAVFQWLTPEESCAVMADEGRAFEVRDEIADVLIYLMRLADVLGVDMAAAVLDKIGRNEDRFPASGTASDIGSGTERYR